MACLIPDWSKLPNELLSLILQYLPIVDNIHFSAVCSSWNYVVSDKSYPPAPELPWLMLPYIEGEEGKETRGFFNLSETKLYEIKLPKEIRHSKCVGSSFGWLVILDGFCRVLLMNPFSGAIIHLPPTETFPDVLGVNVSKSSGEIDHYRIRRHGPDRECSISPARLKVALMTKALVTSDPSVDDNYMIMAIGFSGLAFCKAGADSWILLDRTRNSSKGCDDILYFNGLLYVLDADGAVVSWDVNGLPLKEAKEVAPPLEELSLRSPQTFGDWFVKRRYLVESSGDLLQVLLWSGDIKRSWNNASESAACGVYRLDPTKNTWVEVGDLRDRVLFLSSNCAISLLARNFPQCRENSIYFGEYFWKGWSLEGDPNVAHENLAVFNLEERRFVFCSCALKRIRSPPVWVVPNIL